MAGDRTATLIFIETKRGATSGRTGGGEEEGGGWRAVSESKIN